MVQLAGNALDECRRRVQLAAYRHPDRKTGRTTMVALITTLSTGVPKALQEVITLDEH